MKANRRGVSAVTSGQSRKRVNRSRPTQGDQKRAAWMKREILRLMVAGLIFLGCWVGKTCVPKVQDQFGPMLQNLLSCSCDFEEAVRCFSAQLEGGGDVGDALEDFCVTAFAVQPASQNTDVNDVDVERFALRNTLAYRGTLTDGF